MSSYVVTLWLAVETHTAERVHSIGFVVVVLHPPSSADDYTPTLRLPLTGCVDVQVHRSRYDSRMGCR